MLFASWLSSLALFSTRISKGNRRRHRPLEMVVPGSADYVLESRVMLSATSDDEITDPGDTTTSDTGGSSGDTNTAASGGDTSMGGLWRRHEHGRRW